jgi:hypothetical protein
MKITKIILVFLIFFQQGCGYKSINNFENYKFHIIDYDLTGDTKINNILERNLKRFQNNHNELKKYNLKINSETLRSIVSKDSEGNTISFKVKINVKVSIFENNIFLNEIIFLKDTNYNNLNSKFELSQYEKILKEDLVNQINSELNNHLAFLK